MARGLRRPRRLLTLGAGLLIIGAGVGCGVTDAPEATTEVAQPESTPPASDNATLVEVVDGDTGLPISGAEVVARAGGGGRQAFLTDADGRAEVPAGTESVRAGSEGFNPTTALPSAPDEAGIGARMTIYRSDLQSPVYGGTPERTRYLPEVTAPLPDRAPDWSLDAGSLVEFPPAVRNGLAVFGTNRRYIIAVDALTGERRWARRAEGPIASTPAISGGRVFVTSMDGYLTAYSADAGRELWRFTTDGPTESSPLIVDDLIIFGDTGGTLRAVRAPTGEEVWSYKAAGAIKSAAAQAGDLVIVGDYGGQVQAVNAYTGEPTWSWAGGQRFYGGPGVAGGRVVIGDVGGSVTALNVATGSVDWQRTVGDFVYASPAIADDTVYIGSFTGQLEALSLADGSVKWATPLGGRIGGSATVVGDVVYSSVLARDDEPRRTVAASRADGSILWEVAEGRYTPAVAAGRTLFLVGVRTIEAYHQSSDIEAP